MFVCFCGADQQIVDFLKQIQESSCQERGGRGGRGGGGGGGGGEKGFQGVAGELQRGSRSEQGCAVVDEATGNQDAAATEGEEEEEEDYDPGASGGGTCDSDKEVQELDAVLARRILGQLEVESCHPPPTPQQPARTSKGMEM